MPARIVVVLAVAAFLGLGMEFFATFRAVLSRMPIFTLAFWGLLTLAYLSPVLSSLYFLPLSKGRRAKSLLVGSVVLAPLPYWLQTWFFGWVGVVVPNVAYYLCSFAAVPLLCVIALFLQLRNHSPREENWAVNSIFLMAATMSCVPLAFLPGYLFILIEFSLYAASLLVRILAMTKNRALRLPLFANLVAASALLLASLFSEVAIGIAVASVA